MAVQFPQNPSEGDQFTGGNYIYVYSNGKWVSAGSTQNLDAIIGATGATGPQGADGGGGSGDPGVRYQQGTWTPTSNLGGIIPSSSTWERVGDQVTVRSSVKAFDTLSTTPINILSVPYSVGSESVGAAMASKFNSAATAAYITNTSIQFFQVSVGGANTWRLQEYGDRWNDAGAEIWFEVTYQTNDTTFVPGNSAVVTEDIQGTGGGGGVGADAWGRVAGDGALEGGFNAQSSRTSEGVYAITFTTPMANDTYGITLGGSATLSQATNITTTGFNLRTFDSSNNPKDLFSSFAVHSANSIAPPSGVGADSWGSFDGAGASAILNSSFNIASVVKIGAGDYNITFTTPMPAGDYSVITNYLSRTSSRTSNGFTLQTFNFDGGPASFSDCQFAVFASSTVTPTYTWTRDGTTLKPANDGDGVEVDGPVSSTNSCTAWVNFAGATQLIRSEFNVSSITRLAEGSYRIFFTTPLDNADYAAVATSTNFITALDSQSTNSLDVSTFDNTFARADTSIISVVIYGGKS